MSSAPVLRPPPPSGPTLLSSRARMVTCVCRSCQSPFNVTCSVCCILIARVVLHSFPLMAVDKIRSDQMMKNMTILMYNDDVHNHDNNDESN